MTRYFQKISTLKKLNKKVIVRIFVVIGFLLIIFLIGISSYYISYTSNVYPNLSVANIGIGGYGYQDSASMVAKKIIFPTEIELIYQNQFYYVKTADINLSYDFQASVGKAYNFVRTGNFIHDTQMRIYLLFNKMNFPLVYSVNEEKLVNTIATISKQISTEPVEPSININGEEITVNVGSVGKILDQEALINSIKETLSNNSQASLEIPIKIVDPTLKDEEKSAYFARATKFVGKSINVKFEYTIFDFEDSEIIHLLDPVSGYKDDRLSFFIENIASSVDRNPQNSKFDFDGGKVIEFQPALDGIKTDRDVFKKLLIETLDVLADSDGKTKNIDIPVIKTAPEITMGEVNNLGIKELIGRGSSTYYHSIPTRVHNVALAASRINGTLVKPGDTFSFNQVLGEVSASTGYQKAYIINEGRTTLGDGGGVCQVSTTLFRALLNAGMPITERQAHAYRVTYYEQGSPPGLDATVYSPTPDLKFTNNTPGHILIEAVVDTTNYSLIFELYGTNDGRVSTISKPVVTNVSAPPPDLYQDDPTLPVGTIKQIDWKAWGAKVTFNYSVKKGGEEMFSKTFISNYKPWQAIYLRGTAQ